MTSAALHAQIDALERRLTGIGARAGTLHDCAPDALLDALESVDRDLMLASHALELLRESAQSERASLSALADRAGDA